MRQQVFCRLLRNFFRRNASCISLFKILIHGGTIKFFILWIPAESVLQTDQSGLGRSSTVWDVWRISVSPKHWCGITGGQPLQFQFQLHDCFPGLAGHAVRLEFRPERFSIAEALDLFHKLLINVCRDEHSMHSRWADLISNSNCSL